MKKVTLVFGFTLCLILSAVVVLNAGWWVYTVTEPASSSCNTSVDSCSGTTDGSVWFGKTSNNIYIATKFSAGESYTLCKIVTRLSKNGNPIASVSAAIYSDNSDSPGSIIGSWSSSVAGSSVSTSESAIEFIGLSSPLSSGTSYWVVLKTTSYDADNYFLWAFNNSSCSVEHIVQSSDGNTWSDVYTDRSCKYTTYR